MQKLVIDTNILVSAFISKKGIPAQIIENVVFLDKAIFCVSPEIISEYEVVFSREKFARIPTFQRDAEMFMSALPDIAEIIEPTTRLKVLPDPDDNKFLELAVDAAADFLITGNLRHFPFREFRGVVIISPTEFWEFFQSH